MRTAYHMELARLTEHLGEMCGLAGAAMEHATQALLQADLVLAEQVMSDHEKIAEMSTQAEESAFVLLALQAPVAGDLRSIVSAIQMVADIARMGAPASAHAVQELVLVANDVAHARLSSARPRLV